MVEQLFIKNFCKSIISGHLINLYLKIRMVVGVGFEPTNARSGRIYSPHPLATWIPYQLKIEQNIQSVNGGKTIIIKLSSFPGLPGLDE